MSQDWLLGVVIAGFIGACIGIVIRLAVTNSSSPQQSVVNPAPQRVSSLAGVVGWHQDPYGRHELRYFDGVTWRANVADSGQASTDDIAGAVPPPPGAGDSYTVNQLDTKERDEVAGAVPPPPGADGSYTVNQLDADERGEWVTPESPAGEALAEVQVPPAEGWYADPLNAGRARYVSKTGWSGKTRLVLGPVQRAPVDATSARIAPNQSTECPRCAEVNPATSRFCSRCGEKINQPDVS